MIEPLYQKVVIKQDEKPTQTESGIFINHNLEGSFRRGEVKSIGSKVRDVKVGDRVIYQVFSGNPVVIDDEDFIIMYEAEIVGIEEND